MPVEIVGIKFYTIQETADMLQVSPQSIKLYVKGGKLAGKRINAKWHFSEESIQAYLRKPDNQDKMDWGVE